MEQNIDSQLYRRRSSGACIADGYRLYVGNFLKIFRSSWIAALFYAISVSIVCKLYISQTPLFQIAGEPAGVGYVQFVMAYFALLLGAILLYSAASIVLFSYDTMSFNEHSATEAITGPARWYGKLDIKALLLTLKMFLWMALVLFAASALVGGCLWLATTHLSHTAFLILYLVSVLLITALLIPLSFTCMKYLLTPKARFLSLLAQTYGVGMRHWGSLFVVGLVVGIVSWLFMMLIEMPAIILYVANLQSQVGVLQGDAAGMPDYMGTLTIVVFCVAGFIQAYVYLSTLFPFYYLFGSIESQEKERNEIKKTL
jgi:hypothetical protein